MKTFFRLSIVAFFCMVSCLLTSCNTISSFVHGDRSYQLVDPRFPYMEQNLTTVADETNHDVAVAGKFLGQTAQKPKIAVKSFVNGYTGKEEGNPYDREKPYYYDEYKREMLSNVGKDLMAPLDNSAMKYPAILRSPYLVNETDVASSKEAIAYQKHLDKIDTMLDDAKKFMDEKKYTEALAKVNQALDNDPASEKARALYGEIVRAQERSSAEAELAKQQQAAQAEKEQEQEVQAQAEADQQRQEVAIYIARIDASLQQGDYDEAKRLADILDKIAPDDPRAMTAADNVDLLVFQHDLDPRVLHTPPLMEDLILEHFGRYQEYNKAGLKTLARRELKKISFLESIKDKLEAAE